MSSRRRTDDVNSDGRVDDALLARRDARVHAGVARLDGREVETAVDVSDVRWQVRLVLFRPADARRDAALGPAADRRVGAELQLRVDR